MKISSIKQLTNNFGNNVIILLAMVYITCKLTCNPLFFRQINFHLNWFNIDIKIISSALLFPVTYILSDLMSAMAGRVTAICIVLIGILCDGLFSFIVYFVANLPIPDSMISGQLLNTNAVDTLGLQVWSLFLHGAIATIIANIIEILLFTKLFNKMNSFFMSTVLSVFITLVFHNLITDYSMLRFETDVWQIICNGLLTNMSIITLYATIFSIFIWLKDKLQLNFIYHKKI